MNTERLLLYIGISALVLSAIFGWSFVVFGQHNNDTTQPDYPDPREEDMKENMSLIGNADDLVFCGSDYCIMRNGNIIHCGYLSNGITFCDEGLQ